MRAVIFDMFETLVTLYSVPTYFGRDIAADLGADIEKFYPLWHDMDEDYSKGKMDFEEVIRRIGERVVYAHPERIPEVVKKRYDFKAECFRHVEERILSMLRELKKQGAKIGLISNCFREEAAAIRESVLAPYFDVMQLSCEVGMQKPEQSIFYKCLRELDVKPEECLYVGDGGSMELETAESLGMHPLQATWYLKSPESGIPREGIPQATTPDMVVCTVLQATKFPQ